MHITKAEKKDLEEILALQFLAYQSEAELLHNPNIPPLKQTLPEVGAELKRGVILKAVEAGGAIVGSVRGYEEGGTLFIGKLIVHPARQGQGIGTALLKAMEETCPHTRCELFTSTLSERNIRLYEKNGYRRFREKPLDRDLRLVYLEK